MEITQIKSELSLKQVLDHYQLLPDRNQRLICPWHNDKTPSLQLYPKTNTWTCFSGNCNAGSGDVIDFIMKYENLSKHEALRKATEMLEGNPIQQMSRIAVISKYYQSALQAMARSKKGKAYAEQRNLNYEKLGIGYCGYEVGKTWNKDLQSNAEKLGLFKVKNCLIFATKNKDGKLVSIYGRSVGSNPKVKHFYLSGGFRGLYPNYPKVETKILILCESIIDAATIKQSTNYEVLALYGTNGLTKEHEQAIQSLELLEDIVLFFDGDEAGQAAVEKYKVQLQAIRKDIRISYVKTIEGEDPNSLLESHESEIIKDLIDNRFYFSIENKEQAKQNPGKLITSNPELLTYENELLCISILGGIKITGLDRMRVTLKIERKGNNYLPLRHSLDLYHSRQVEQLTQNVAERMELGSSQTEKSFVLLTNALESYRQEKLEQLKPKPQENPSMSGLQRAEVMKYLKDKKLMRKTLDDIAKSGIVGESNNALIAYLAYTSRKRSKPLHIMCMGASGTGKTYLQEKVSELIPEEEKIEITSLSDNAFYYFGREELKHKLILIEDLDGAENVLYPLRELQSKRRISKTVTLKDNKGNLKTITLKVEGPVCVSGCTTREKIYEDNANRCILLYIDDSNSQDLRIMQYQQKASAGMINAKAEQQIIEKMQNVQRLLQPIKIINPYAELIDLPQEVFKPRRTLLLLLSFIETITFYHQYQRPKKTDPQTQMQYIESTPEDIEAAFSLMKEVLFSKSDELSKASRKFLEQLKTTVSNGEVFYTSEVRKKLRLSSSTIHRYIRELKINGYIKYKGGNRSKGYEYEIVDYEEYQKLKANIDHQLASIMQKIKGKRVPVSQPYPTSQNGINKTQEINVLT